MGWGPRPTQPGTSFLAVAVPVLREARKHEGRIPLLPWLSHLCPEAHLCPGVVVNTGLPWLVALACPNTARHSGVNMGGAGNP